MVSGDKEGKDGREKHFFYNIIRGSASAQKVPASSSRAAQRLVGFFNCAFRTLIGWSGKLRSHGWLAAAIFMNKNYILLAPRTARWPHTNLCSGFARILCGIPWSLRSWNRRRNSLYGTRPSSLDTLHLGVERWVNISTKRTGCERTCADWLHLVTWYDC